LGDPRRLKRKYAAPPHPWQTARLIEERSLMQKFGLKKKREIWRLETMLRGIRSNARRLLAATGPYVQIETKQLLNRLIRLGLLNEGATLDDVLALKTDDLLNRRLQTIVYAKGFAKTVDQARQFITHGHIMIGGRQVTVPSYLVMRDEEEIIKFNPNSPIGKNPQHPERPMVAGVKEKIEETPSEKGEEEA